MAIFANSAATQTTAVTATATLVFDVDATNIPAGTLHDVTLMNIDKTNPVYLGQSGVTATTGLQLTAGAQITYDGYSKATTDATGDIYAICASSKTATVVAGLASLNTNA